MKFISEGLILSDAAMTVSKACSTKTTTPVLECIKISAQNDAVTLIAYDGEISAHQGGSGRRLFRGEGIGSEIVDCKDGILLRNGREQAHFEGLSFGDGRK